MSIWKRITGGWFGSWGSAGLEGTGTVGSAGEVAGSMTITDRLAMGLSAVHACVSLRAEVAGTLPCHLRDKNKNLLKTHPLYNILHRSPNADMTAAEYWSLCTAMEDLHGNSVSVIERGVGKKVVALTPFDPTQCSFELNKSGRRKVWRIGREEVHDDDVLHVAGFSLGGGWGAPRIDLGRQIMQAQLEANASAMAAFKNGLKVGGFLLNERTSDLTNEQINDIGTRLSVHSRPENAGKMMLMLRGMKPISGAEFRVSATEAQLLESRHFGIEEICRLFNVPPPLIGHTSKASSWASSLEGLNLHFQTYSIAPTIIRREQRIEKKLLSPYDIAEGVECKVSMQALLRGDMKSRMAFYASGLQNGYLNRDEVRDLEERGKIPEGDVYTVQLNMGGIGDNADDKPAKKPKDDDE